MKLSRLLDLLIGKRAESQQKATLKMIPVYVPANAPRYGRRRY